MDPNRTRTGAGEASKFGRRPTHQYWCFALGVTCVAISGQLVAAALPAGELVSWGAIVLPSVEAGTVFTNIAAGESHSLAITSDARVIAWGANITDQAI